MPLRQVNEFYKMIIPEQFSIRLDEASTRIFSVGHGFKVRTFPLLFRCIQIPVKSESPQLESKGDCAGCGDALVDGQALVALDKQWHIYCFKCTACGQLLHGEYMSKDDKPYCEKDYQTRFGVKCAHCQRYISGKVLQAGEDSHFHPTCARCSKCGDPFGDGEEMYLQGKRPVE